MRVMILGLLGTMFIDQLLGLIYAMLALAILIALLGIANTLAAVWPARRAAKLDVLRAVVTE